jgi:alpha-N-arabinofuranosidase
VAVDAGRVLRTIPRALYGANVEWRWNGNLLWDEKRRRPDPRLVALARAMGVSLIRFPGGLYSDLYHWRDGVGPPEKRREVVHQPGSDERSIPFFGTDEALALAREVNASLLITVNAGAGTAEEAADWVRYVNATDLRVRDWEIGNELYYDDGSPVARAVKTDAATYAERVVTFARAMRAADPRIRVGAIGGLDRGRYRLFSDPTWTRPLLARAGNEIDFLAVHDAYAPLLREERRDVRSVYRAMLAAPVLVARNLAAVEALVKEAVPGRKIGIAVTEWGPFFQTDFASPWVDHPKTLGSALYAASALKAIVESPATESAAFWLLNDVSVLGWIGSTSDAFPPRPEWAKTARALALELFTKHFGERLVATECHGPTFDSEAVGWVDEVKGAPVLEVVSSLDAAGTTLTLLAINKDFDAPVDAAFDIAGFDPHGGVAWTLNGTGLDANTGTKVIRAPGIHLARQKEDEQNPRFAKGGPGEVTLVSRPFPVEGARFSYRFPPHSATALVLRAKGDAR